MNTILEGDHIDGTSEREDESGYPPVDTAVLLHRLDGNRQDGSSILSRCPP